MDVYVPLICVSRTPFFLFFFASQPSLEPNSSISLTARCRVCFINLYRTRTGCCATIFSASNYGGSMNQGATMQFSLNETDDSFAAGGIR